METAHTDQSAVRHASAAGKFYPLDPYELMNIIENSIKANVINSEKSPKALLVPHSNYSLTSKILGKAYGVLARYKYDEIFVLGPSHFSKLDKLIFADYRIWQTPLGQVETSKRVSMIAHSDDHSSHDILGINNEPHSGEHSVEIHLPYLRFLFGEQFKLIPALVGDCSPRIGANYFIQLMDKNDLLIVSGELSQGYPGSSGKEMDRVIIEAIKNVHNKAIDYNSLFKDCTNATGLALLCELALKNRWKPELIEYQHSSDSAFETSRETGLAAIAFF